MNNIARHWIPSILALSFALLALAACGGNEEAREDVPTATVAGETSAATSPAADAAGGTPATAPPTATPVAEPQGTSRVSLDEYLSTVCGQTEVGTWEEGESLRELSEGLGFISEQMSALEPPVEVAEWHDAQVEFADSFKETIDDYLEDPGGQSEDEFLISMFFTLAPLFEPVEQAIADMDAEIRTRMAEANCIDDEPVAAAPVQDTTSTVAEREEIFDGVSVAGALAEPDESGRFRFDAEAGETYFVEVTWQDLPSIKLSIFMSPGFNWIYNSVISPVFTKWTPEVSGMYDMTISSESAGGTYELSVWQSAAPDSPANIRNAWEGEEIVISWDPVEGAEYYNIYYSEHSGFSCSIRADGRPRFCDELATDVVNTNYIHASPEPRDSLLGNYYWVVACNSEGCSEPDSDNPVSP